MRILSLGSCSGPKSADWHRGFTGYAPSPPAHTHNGTSTVEGKDNGQCGGSEGAEHRVRSWFNDERLYGTSLAVYLASFAHPKVEVGETSEGRCF